MIDYMPHIGEDEKGNATFEWWVGERKITVYPSENILIKVWGLDIDTEMEDMVMDNAEKVRNAFQWLVESD